MKITSKQWINYRNRLSAINQKAAELMQRYVDANGYEVNAEMIDYAYSLTSKYGEAASELACQLYDETAAIWNASNKAKKAIAAAEPAPALSRTDIARIIFSASNYSQEAVVPAVTRAVKLVSQDTVLHNALRDGAEFAWIPSGDTCAFCLTLASNGWRKASKKALKNGHAEHIHANCDCAYAVRFDSNMEVEGYDPGGLCDEYLSYGGSPKEKINAMRRENYAARKSEINEQKRIAYAKRKQLNESGE